MDLRAPFIPFVHVPGISFDLIKEIKKKTAVKIIKKNFTGNPYHLAMKMSTTKNSKPQLKNHSDFLTMLTLDINILEIVQVTK